MTHPDDLGQRTRAQAERLRAIIAEARVESVSEDHAVRVAVGPQGALLDVEITSRARGRDAAEIGALLVAEIKKANRQLAAELGDRMAEVLGVAGTARPGGPVAGPALPQSGEVRGDLAELRRERALLKEETPAPTGASAAAARAFDAEGAMAKLDAIQDQVERLLEGFQSILGEDPDGDGDDRAEATSDDGLARVVLDEDGAVDRIDLSDAAMHNASRAGYAVVQAAKQAKVVYSAKLVEMMDKLGDADPFGMMAKAREQMPGEVGEMLRQREAERRDRY